MEDMVAESVKYTVLGMGIVFLFLYVLVLALRLQKIVIARFFPSETAGVSPRPETAGEGGGSRRKIAAMTAAIHHYKKTRNQA